MSEIAARVGGSKATLYSYFPSKEELFLAVVRSVAENHLRTTFGDLDAGRSVRENLLLFSERFIRLLASNEIINSHRYLVGEAGKSSVGRLFYEQGPRVGQDETSRFLATAMGKGELRKSDPEIAAKQLVALCKAEHFEERLLAVREELSEAEVREMAARAVDLFMRGYAPD
ncbi:TetR/AcrR family transcriptional regulator TvrR [Viridibacterium curvum]|uniref:TetR/AcrR family transcriptional regulator TvrR n=2 Tax=Viridibacterium curvum TaxID=1101404 RepID=A0ABP9QGT2_9RHOO